MTDADLDAIEAAARRRTLACEHSERLPSGARGAPCQSVATQRCMAGGDCGIARCDAHAVEHSGACDHRWERIEDGVADVLALVAEVRRLRAELASAKR